MKKNGNTAALSKLMQRKGGILLDVGCGSNKQSPQFIGMDKRKLPGVDIVHDLEVFPYPLPSECCVTITAAHIIEHIKPWLFFDVMNELWRIMKLDGQCAIAHPYAGSSGYWLDPTHCLPLTEASWQYLDPRSDGFDVYEPKPWQIQPGYPVWNILGNVELVLMKISVKEAEERIRNRKEKGVMLFPPTQVPMPMKGPVYTRGG